MRWVSLWLVWCMYKQWYESVLYSFGTLLQSRNDEVFLYLKRDSRLKKYTCFDCSRISEMNASHRAHQRRKENNHNCWTHSSFRACHCTFVYRVGHIAWHPFHHNLRFVVNECEDEYTWRKELPSYSPEIWSFGWCLTQQRRENVCKILPYEPLTSQRLEDIGDYIVLWLNIVCRTWIKEIMSFILILDVSSDIVVRGHLISSVRSSDFARKMSAFIYPDQSLASKWAPLKVKQ